MQNIYKKESICEFCNSNKISLEYCIKDDSIYKCNRCGIMFSDFDKEKLINLDIQARLETLVTKHCELVTKLTD